MSTRQLYGPLAYGGWQWVAYKSTYDVKLCLATSIYMSTHI